MASIQLKYAARGTEVLKQLGANTTSEGSKGYGLLKVFYWMPIGYLIQLELSQWAWIGVRMCLCEGILGTMRALSRIVLC
jgi:hypothetical protein